MCCALSKPKPVFALSVSVERTQERRGDMKMRRSLTDEDGEVRELLMEDIRRFRPMAEGISATLAAKLGIKVHPDAEKMSPKKRKSGIPTGNAGEYFVMGELLRRGFDAQLADRNTKS